MFIWIIVIHQRKERTFIFFLYIQLKVELVGPYFHYLAEIRLLIYWEPQQYLSIKNTLWLEI